MIALLAALAFQCPDGSPPPCRTARAAPVNPSSVAVLYFETASRDTDNAQLAVGLTEELITRLSQVDRLEVKSRYESRRVRGSADDPRAIGRTLRAAYLVSGSLQQAGSRTRLNVSLIRASTGAQVWGDVFDRVGEDALTVQSDIAREVSGAITGRLLPAERATLTRRPTRDALAYDLYLRGLGAANGTSEEGTRAAMALFDRAIARDSSFADAWAQKAWAWLWLADGYMVARDAYPRAREAANRALRLDSSQAMAWAILSVSAQALDLDHAATMENARRAVAANPRSPEAHSQLGEAFEMEHQFIEGAREHRIAFALDTLSVNTAWIYLSFLNHADMIDSLAAVLPHTRSALSPVDIQHWEGVLKLRRGDAAGAARQLTWQYYGGAFAEYYVMALLAQGRRDAAIAVRDSLLEYASQHYFNAFGIAAVYAALGDADHAFAMLERAYDERTVWLSSVTLEPAFASLRSDPRYAAFLRRLGYT